MRRLYADFVDADVCDQDVMRNPRVLLLPYEEAAGLNLMTSAADVVFFEPLWHGEDPVPGARAAANCLRIAYYCYAVLLATRFRT